jgi:hypothetical protein
MRKITDLTNKKFGRLKVIKIVYIKKVLFWECICDCGNKNYVHTHSLTHHKISSCGCLKTELMKSILHVKNRIHGMSKTRFHKIWEGMLQRCTNKNSTAYFLYGGRGIKILNNWKKFINFKNDMYQSYLDHVNKFGENNTTLDRINVDDNYCVNNCRWATWKQQNNNKQINKLKLII